MAALCTAACGSPAAKASATPADVVSADAVSLGDAATSSTAPQPVEEPYLYADPRMGSGGYAFAFGSAFPGATAPNGMMRVGPDTSGPYATIGFLHFSGYWGGDDTVRAFSHLHLHGTGAQDYGSLGILPVPAYDPSKVRIEQYASTFAKTSEVATPGFYAVTLDNGPINAAFTATVHAAHERFTFPAGSSSGTLILDLAHGLSKVTASHVSLDPASHSLTGDLQTNGGMSGGYKLFFTIRCKDPWTAQHVWVDSNAATDANTASGKGVGVALDFDLASSPTVELQVGLSMVSAAGATANLASELTSFDLVEILPAAKEAWNKRLQVLKVYGGTEDQRRLFYSSLHHTFVMPGTYSDVDGSYSYQGTTANTGGFRFLTDISGWDVYRSLSPLHAIVARDVALDEVQSLFAMAKITGNFPKWPLATGDSGSMIGAAADVIIADAYLRGITQFDAAAVYQRLRDAALEAKLPAGEGRGGRDFFEDYSASGYVYAGHGACVSMTCELNEDDFALANFASALGKTADAQTLLARSTGYQKLYDPATGFLRAHDASGKIPDDGFKADDFGMAAEYDEADAYQTEFCAQHDPAGMAQLWGGKDKLIAALSDLFAKTKAEHEANVAELAADGGSTDPNAMPINLPPTYYFGGNEPDIHYVYLFARLGRPDLTQQWLPWIMNAYFSSGITGLPGNDDGGTMTAWYVFGALGFYPVPGSDLYIVGTPQFPRVDIQVDGGVFSVVAHGVSDANRFIQGAQLGGQPLTVATFHHADLKAGSSLVLEMGPQPSAWGQTP